MKLTHARRTGRRGFTLVELMVVIAIISVLVSLITAAVWKAVVTANRVRNSNEISQLAVAVENFKNKFGIYPPSRIVLCEAYDFYFVNNDRSTGTPKSKLHADSIFFLQQIWPRINFDSLNKPSLSPSTWWKGIDWNGNGKLDAGDFLLEGDQCLVFFLGGIPGGIPPNGFCSGFSTNPQNPAFAIGAGSETIAPFFEFQSTRLIVVDPGLRAKFVTPGKQPIPVSRVHFSYQDTYVNAPYAYFSSYKTRNGYNAYATAVGLESGGALESGGLSSDCSSLGVWPYAESPILTTSSILTTRYLNPSTFQIISAGANGKIAGVSGRVPTQAPDMGFGRGTQPTNPYAFWTAAVAGTTQASWDYAHNDREAGLDDQSNFSDAPLGVPSK